MENGWGEYRRITWSIKNRPHIYVFWRKIFMDLIQFSHYDFVIFPPLYFICVLCRAKILPQIYTRIIASLKPPPIYAHYTRGKFRHQIYMRIAVRLESVGDWLTLVSLRSFVSCFVYVVIVWIKSFLLIGRCQNSL